MISRWFPLRVQEFGSLSNLILFWIQFQSENFINPRKKSINVPHNESSSILKLNPYSQECDGNLKEKDVIVKTQDQDEKPFDYFIDNNVKICYVFSKSTKTIISKFHVKWK